MTAGSAITAEMKECIGRRLFPDFPPEEVTTWGIKRYLEATTDENPLWTDAEYARKTCWGGPLAPPGILEAFNPANHAFRRFSDMSHMALPFEPPFPRTFSAYNEMEFFAPVRPGDLITSTCRLGDIYERDSKTGSGRMVFIRMDNHHYNQRGELVGTTSEAMVSVEGKSNRAAAAEVPAPAARKPNPQPPVTGKVFFEDVETGLELPPLVKSFNMFIILKWAAAVNDYGPHHFDYQFATQFLGLPNVIVHGPHNTAHLAQLVTNWMGGWGALKKHYAEMRGNVFPGDTLTFEGRIAGKCVRDGQCSVDIESWADNQNGRRVMLGRSTVTLPSRDSGR